MSASEYLKGLPSYNESNFAKFQPDSSCKVTAKRPCVYVSTKDYPAEQIIITEKTNILLRYLTKHMEKKYPLKKREGSKASTSGGEDEVVRKRLRLELP